jgi:hypothetical protein
MFFSENPYIISFFITVAKMATAQDSQGLNLDMKTNLDMVHPI